MAPQDIVGAPAQARILPSQEETQHGHCSRTDPGKIHLSGGSGRYGRRRRWLGLNGITRPEYRGIPPLGQFDDRGLVFAFFRKILLQLLSQLRSVDTDERVLAGIEVRRAAKYLDPDLLLPNRSFRVSQLSLSDEKKKLAQAIREQEI